MKIGRNKQIWRLVWLWSLCVILIFALLDFIETRYFPNLDRQTIRMYHLIRGGAGAAITSVLAVLFVYHQRKRFEQELVRSERLAAMGKMSSLFAHEVKNPLGSISLNVELLGEELHSPSNGSPRERQALLRAILGEVERMAHITDAYLRFARFPKPVLQPTTIDEMIDHLLEVVHGEAARRGVQIEKKIERDLPLLSLDREQIHQALLNIVKNSFEAMDHGGTLTLQAGRLGDTVVMTISDTGPGMSEEQRSRIFEPFFSTKSYGTGLGLTIALQAIQEHGGDVSCESAIGQGSRFLIHLPIQRKIFAERDGIHAGKKTKHSIG